MEIAHFFILFAMLILTSIVSIEYFESCRPVTPMTYDLIIGKMKPGDIPLCKIADPIGSDEYSMSIPKVNCNMSEWQKSGECLADCGKTGTQVYTRKTINRALNGGTACPTDLIESRTCTKTCEE